MNTFCEFESALDDLLKDKPLTNKTAEILRNKLPDNHPEAVMILDYFIAEFERKEKKKEISNSIIYGIAYPGLTLFLSVLLSVVAAVNPSNLPLLSIVGGITSIIMIIISLLLARKTEKISIIDGLYEVKREYLMNCSEGLMMEE